MYKILKIVVGILSLLGCVFLVRIMFAGDTVLKEDYKAQLGNSELVDGLFNPFAVIMYIVLAMILAFVVFFVVKNLLSGGGSIKNTFIGVGAFVAILLIAYVMSGGDTLQYFYDDKMATEAQSQMVGAGLVSFYILSVISIAAMAFSGLKKLIK